MQTLGEEDQAKVDSIFLKLLTITNESKLNMSKKHFE